MGAVGPERNSDEGKGRLCKSKKIWGHVDCGEGISGGGWVLLALKETVTRVTIGKVKRSRGVVGHGERICMRRCYLYEEGASMRRVLSV